MHSGENSTTYSRVAPKFVLRRCTSSMRLGHNFGRALDKPFPIGTWWTKPRSSIPAWRQHENQSKNYPEFARVIDVTLFQAGFPASTPHRVRPSPFVCKVNRTTAVHVRKFSHMLYTGSAAFLRFPLCRAPHVSVFKWVFSLLQNNTNSSSLRQARLDSTTQQLSTKKCRKPRNHKKLYTPIHSIAGHSKKRHVGAATPPPSTSTRTRHYEPFIFLPGGIARHSRSTVAACHAMRLIFEISCPIYLSMSPPSVALVCDSKRNKYVGKTPKC